MKLPSDYTDEEWEKLSNPDQRTAWNNLLRVLHASRQRLGMNTNFDREKWRILTEAMDAAAEQLKELVREERGR